MGFPLWLKRKYPLLSQIRGNGFELATLLITILAISEILQNWILTLGS
jgi:hypothetical protein